MNIIQLIYDHPVITTIFTFAVVIYFLFCAFQALKQTVNQSEDRQKQFVILREEFLKITTHEQLQAAFGKLEEYRKGYYWKDHSGILTANLEGILEGKKTMIK